VRRNFVRGKFGTPKSTRSSRSIPLADDVARELELLYQASSYQADEDLVFAHPRSGKPRRRSPVRTASPYGLDLHNDRRNPLPTPAGCDPCRKT
jgi:hypothetical protein